MGGEISREVPDGATPAVPYGTSDHYLGLRGEEYFAWQGGGGDFGALIQRRKFVQFVQPMDTVVDFGCGGGFLLNSLACKHRIGIEINPAARTAAERAGVECHADTAELADGSADIVVSDHALEHVPFPIGAVREFHRILRPQGRLVIVTPIDSVRRYPHYDAADIHHHLHQWTPQQMGNTLAEAGFIVDSVRARVYAWPGRWTVACYGRLPYWLFRTICYVYGRLSGRGGELIAVAHRR
jgi:SAM-dependent methyltransferase